MTAPLQTTDRSFVMVCSANICRSPLAEALLIEAFAARYCMIRCTSGGVLGIVGREAAAYSRLIAAERGKRLRRHLDKHRSQALTYEMCAQADRVFCMEQAHIDKIRDAWGDGLNDKLILLGTLIGQRDIADPYGGPEEGYRIMAGQVERAVQVIADQVLGPVDEADG